MIFPVRESSEKLDLCLNYSKSRANLSCGKNRVKIRKKSCNVNNNIGLGNIKISGVKEKVTFYPDFRLVFGVNHDFFFIKTCTHIVLTLSIKKIYENFILFVQCSVDRHTALYLRRAVTLVPSDMIENRWSRSSVPPPRIQKAVYTFALGSLFGSKWGRGDLFSWPTPMIM